MKINKADFSKLNILVVDDSKFVRQLVAEILDSFGVGKVVATGSAEEALKRVEDYLPDIIISDWQMHPIDGLTLLRKLRQKSSTRVASVPFIMLTGHSGAEDVSKALGEGADSYIVKPFSSQTLMNHILKVALSDAGLVASSEVTEI